MKEFDKPLSANEEREYFSAFKKGQHEAFEMLINRNMRLVAHMVKKYTTSDLEAEDMLSIGTIGLIKAIKSFDYEKGSRFATYAAKCIDNELLMTLRNNKKRVRDVLLSDTMTVDKEGNEVSFFEFAKDLGESVEDQVCKKCEIERLNKAVRSALSDRERKIIELRYGLNNTREMTQNEVAKLFNISRSYVSRIEKKALYKLKASIDN